MLKASRQVANNRDARVLNIGVINLFYRVGKSIVAQNRFMLVKPSWQIKVMSASKNEFEIIQIKADQLV